MFNALTKFGITPVYCSLGSAAKIVTGNAANDTARFSRITSLLSLVRGSIADSADVDNQWTQHDVQDDKRRLVRHSEVFCRFLPHESQENGRQYKWYRTQNFAWIPVQLYSIKIIYYTYIYIYIYIAIYRERDP